jgi:hypothetical protein
MDAVRGGYVFLEVCCYYWRQFLVLICNHSVPIRTLEVFQAMARIHEDHIG